MILDLIARLITWLSPKMITFYVTLGAVIYVSFGGYAIYSTHGWERIGYIALYAFSTLFIFWPFISEWSRARLRKKRRADISFKATDFSEE